MPRRYTPRPDFMQRSQMERSPQGLMHKCRWPGCDYDAELLVGTTTMRLFHVCRTHARRWRMMEYHELEKTFACLQSPRAHQVTALHASVNRLVNVTTNDSVGEYQTPDYYADISPSSTKGT